MPGPPVTRKRSTGRRPSETTSRDDADDWLQPKATVKPDDQLQLTEQEMKEEFTRILTANNPHAPQNIVRYSFKDRQYKPIPQVDQLAVHFHMEGNLIHKESDEGKVQLTREEGIGITAEETIAEAEEEVEEKEYAEGEGEEGDKPAASKKSSDGKPTRAKKLMNQFNFCERASQTFNNPIREKATETEPPPRTTFSANVSQWGICDNYVEDFERNQEKNKDKKAPPVTVPGQKPEERIRKKLVVNETQVNEYAKIKGPLKIIERMVNQNTFEEITHDFKYYEDPSDEYRDQMGTLLPLWRFNYEKARKMAITALVWSPKYHDLYAVGLGSYDFQKQGKGMICFYTLKNPSYPEYVFETESGVMSLDLHPESTHMLCVAFYDGSVGVYNVTQRKNEPLFISTAKTGKHTDPVWQVRWQKNDLDNNMNFFSVSADGRVSCWTMVKNHLEHYDVIILKLPTDGPLEGPEGTRLITCGSGTTLDFHKTTDHLFLVGTEEGNVHKCSKAYSSQFLDTFHSHHMAVYKVAWNPFHGNIFITCSADWTVKIWDHTKQEPLFVFDLGSPVGDVAWSPYSSTIFSAVSADGKVFLFDLNVNKYEPLCEQVVAVKKKTRLTHVSFNPIHPMLVVGDDRGYVASFKLSPNLRKMPKDKKATDASKNFELETAKLEKILALVG